MSEPAVERKIYPEARELADILMVLQRCLMMHLSRDMARGSISFPQFFLLGYLDHQGVHTMTQVAEKMGHTTAAATGLVDRLQRLGYVTRIHDERDRRRVLVSITEKGIELVGAIREEMVTNLSEVMDLLTAEEQASWLAIYRKVHDHCSSDPDGQC